MRHQQMPTQKLNRELLIAAIDGFEFQKLRIDAQIVEIRRLLDGDSAESEAPDSETPRSGRKKFSAASRRKMAAAQKARWAKIKGEAAPAAKTAKPKAGKAKRRLSAEGRAAIVAALKKRWAAKKSSAPAKAAKKKAVKTSPHAAQAAA